MPRQPSYWNVIPVTVTGAEDPHAVLKNWGIRPWGRDKPLLIHVGWQRVSLPQGWQIILEEYSHLLVDDRDQVRGKIINAFRRIPDKSPLAQTVRAALTDGTKKKGAPAKKKARPAPTLQLQTSLSLRRSFCLGDKGPYSYWVENALGERVHGIYDVEVSNKEAKEKLPQLAKQVEDWLNKEYPNWKSHEAYWDIFN